MSPQVYRLVMQTGPNPGKVLDLSTNEVTMGRDTNNEFVVNDAEVSRKHARVSLQGGNYVLEDLGSTNGTFIEGQRLMGPHVLRPGDLILLGENVSLRFEASTFDPDATMVAPSSGGTIAAGTPPFQPEEEPLPPYEPTYPEPPDQPLFTTPAPFQGGAVEYQAPPPPPPPMVSAPRKKGNRNMVVIVVILLILLCLCAICAAGAYYIDSNNLWCAYLPFLFSGCR